MSLPTPFYDQDGCTIFVGDCREIVPHLPKVEAQTIAIITDPPYGLKNSSCLKNDYVGFDDEPQYVLDLILPILNLGFTRYAITPGQNMMFKYPEPDAVGAFYYPAGCGSCSWGFVGWQPIFFYGKDPYLAQNLGRRSNCKVSTESAEINGHPCPKPIKAWTWLVERASSPADTIIDPFMGSGTTLRAAKDLGRRCIGIEINEAYAKIAVERLRQGVLNLA